MMQHGRGGQPWRDDSRYARKFHPPSAKVTIPYDFGPLDFLGFAGSFFVNFVQYYREVAASCRELSPG
jgi:hypothetical protein